MIFLNNTDDFRKAFDNVDQLYKLSEEGPKFIREFINNNEHLKVKKFLEETVLS